MVDIQHLAETTLGTLERFSVKAELKRAHDVIQPGETVQMLAVGAYKGAGNNLIIVTDQRLIAINEVGAFNKRLQTHDVRHERVSSVQSESSRASGRITLNTSGGDVDIEKVLPTGRSDEIANYIRSRIGMSSAPAAVSYADELKKLAALRDAGIVTPDEFDAKKADILARM